MSIVPAILLDRTYKFSMEQPGSRASRGEMELSSPVASEVTGWFLRYPFHGSRREFPRDNNPMTPSRVQICLLKPGQ